MSLSLAERSLFYDELGKLLSAGFPYLQSIETILSARPRASTRAVLLKLKALALQELSVTESMSSPGLPFSKMEISLIAASEKSGQLQRGCEFLARYFARLDVMFRQVLRRALYPVFMLHAGVLLLALPRFFQNEAVGTVVRDIIAQLGIFYLITGAAYLAVKAVLFLAQSSVSLDRMLNLIPLIGGIRRSLAISRFCTAYQMQLDAGVNIMDSLESAAQASASAIIRGGIHSVLPMIRAGEPAGPALAVTGTLPANLVRGMVIGEQTGTLDAELLRAANEYDEKALRGIESIGDWLPKIIYFVIVIFLAWNIISTAKTSMTQLDKIIDGE